MNDSGLDKEYCSLEKHYNQEYNIKKQEPFKINSIFYPMIIFYISLIICMFITKGLRKGAQSFLTTTIFILPIFLFMFFINHIYEIWNTKDYWCYDPNHRTDLLIIRRYKRAELAGIVMVFSGIIQSLMIKYGADSQLVFIFYGFIFTSILNFAINQLTSDAGYKLYKNNPKIALRYVLGQFTTSVFGRNLISIFLDLFIQMPLQPVLEYFGNAYMSSFIAGKTGFSILDEIPLFSYIIKKISNNIDVICRSLLQFLTSYSYGKDLLIYWVDPPISLLRNRLVEPFAIKLAILITGTIFMLTNFYTKSKYSLSSFVITIVAFISLVFKLEPQTKFIEEIKIVEERNELIKKKVLKENTLEKPKDIEKKWKLGFAIFAILFFIGFVIPFNVTKSSIIIYFSLICLIFLLIKN